MLFRQADSDGFSLVHVTFAPNYMLPRHSHDVDCVYYVLCGEVVLGRRVVGAGSGFFVPKDQPYAYQAGPDGVDLLEFRHSTSFDYVVHEENPARWRAIIDAVRPEPRAQCGASESQERANSMKAYRMIAWKTPAEYQEVPVPEPGPGQVLVKVGAAGLCHSDLHVLHEFEEGTMNGSPPFTLGHENAGWVEALGPAHAVSKSVKR